MGGESSLIALVRFVCFLPRNVFVQKISNYMSSDSEHETFGRFRFTPGRSTNFSWMFSKTADIFPSTSPQTTAKTILDKSVHHSGK